MKRLSKCVSGRERIESDLYKIYKGLETCSMLLSNLSDLALANEIYDRRLLLIVQSDLLVHTSKPTVSYVNL